MNEQKDGKSVFTEYFKIFYQQYVGDMVFFARHFVDAHVAEDIVHDLFLKIWDKRSTIIVEDNIKNYLLSMVQNACYDYLKHQQVKDVFLSKAIHQLKLDELKNYESQKNNSSEKDTIDSVYASIEKLPTKRKGIFKMAYFEGMKYADIANELDISVRTVETQVYKALKFLRNHLSVIPAILAIASFFM